jgi:Holliday junction resolvase
MSSLSKQKGNRLEYEVAKFYQRKLDKDARRMPTSGALSNYKSDILKRLKDDWVDECKSRAKMSIYDLWKQAQDQAGEFKKPVLYIKANNKPILAVIRIEDYFDMREELEDYRNK